LQVVLGPPSIERHEPLQQALAHSAELPTAWPAGTQATHAPTLVSHAKVPASLSDTQSESVLHSTQVPAMFEFVLLPQTWFGGLLSAVQLVPVAAGVKQGVRGEGPQQDGLVWHTLLGVGRFVGASTSPSPPLPLHASAWQVPARPVCRLAGLTVFPGYTQAPEESQSVAPHAATLAEHVAVQQCVPVPLTPQRPFEHWSAAEHCAPAPPLDVHVPLDVLQ
jgi:hypothetical protein